jgi:hypothetical protein
VENATLALFGWSFCFFEILQLGNPTAVSGEVEFYRFKPETDAVLKELVGKSSVSRDYTFVRHALSSSEAVCGKKGLRVVDNKLN